MLNGLSSIKQFKVLLPSYTYHLSSRTNTFGNSCHCSSFYFVCHLSASHHLLVRCVSAAGYCISASQPSISPQLSTFLHLFYRCYSPGPTRGLLVIRLSPGPFPLLVTSLHIVTLPLLVVLLSAAQLSSSRQVSAAGHLSFRYSSLFYSKSFCCFALRIIRWSKTTKKQ